MVDGLRILGHDVFDIKEQKLHDLKDSEIYDLAQRLNRIIISMDKDFSSILLYPLVNITESLLQNFIASP